MPESKRSEASFSESIDQLIGAIRALLLGHWSLLRAEIGAIARDVVVTLIGAAAIVSAALFVALVFLAKGWHELRKNKSAFLMVQIAMLGVIGLLALTR